MYDRIWSWPDSRNRQWGRALGLTDDWTDALVDAIGDVPAAELARHTPSVSARALDSEPVGSVAIDRDGFAYQREGDGRWAVAGFMERCSSAALAGLGARVVYRITAEDVLRPEDRYEGGAS